MFARSWWALLLRGLVGIGFSVVAWARPHPTLAILVVVIGAYAIGDGALSLIGAARAASREEGWWLPALEGVFGMTLGILTLVMPAKALSIAFVLVAVWALSTGVLELLEAGRLRTERVGGWLLLSSGLIRIAFGVLLLSSRSFGVRTLLWITAAYTLVDGVILIALSLRMKRHGSARRRAGAGGMTAQPA